MSNVVASVDGHKSHLDGFVVSLAIVAAIHDTKNISRLASLFILPHMCKVQENDHPPSWLLTTNWQRIVTICNLETMK